jgi:hypothetical protein
MGASTTPFLQPGGWRDRHEAEDVSARAHALSLISAVPISSFPLAHVSLAQSPKTLVAARRVDLLQPKYSDSGLLVGYRAGGCWKFVRAKRGPPAIHPRAHRARSAEQRRRLASAPCVRFPKRHKTVNTTQLILQLTPRHASGRCPATFLWAYAPPTSRPILSYLSPAPP